MSHEDRFWIHECPTVADQYEGTTIETIDVGFTFAGGEKESASTRICIPHAEFPQGISVNVVSNESAPFLIGLDVLREYGLVIDYHHYNRVHSHILKLNVAFLVQFFRRDILLWKRCRATVNGDSTQWRVKPSRLDTGACIRGHKRKERFQSELHPHYIFMTRCQDTSTDTHPQAMTIC